MTFLVLVVAVLAILGVVLWAARSFAVAPAVTCTVEQIPAVFDRLRRDGRRLDS